LIEDLLYQKSKIKWNINEIKKGEKEINNQELELNMSIRNNEHNIIHFIIEYDDDIIPVDIALVLENSKKQEENKNELFDKKVYLMFIKREYYFILAYFKKYFKGKKEFNKIKYLLDDKYGHYKQILMNIFYLIQFLEYPIYNNNEFQKIYDKIMKKAITLDINQEFFDDIMKNFHDNNKIKELLKKLESKIMFKLNTIFENYAYNYYLKIPNNNQIKFADLVFDVKN